MYVGVCEVCSLLAFFVMRAREEMTMTRGDSGMDTRTKLSAKRGWTWSSRVGYMVEKSQCAMYVRREQVERKVEVQR